MTPSIIRVRRGPRGGRVKRESAREPCLAAARRWSGATERGSARAAAQARLPRKATALRTNASAHGRRLPRLENQGLSLVSELRADSSTGAAAGSAASPRASGHAAPVVELPGGIVTFLFSDVEGSTPPAPPRRAVGGRARGAAAAAPRRGDRSRRQRGGRSGRFLLRGLHRASAAVAASAAAQRALHAAAWPDGVEVRLRMGVHTGEPIVAAEGYLGLAVVRAARICAVAGGGRVLVSEATRGRSSATRSRAGSRWRTPASTS